MIYSIMIRAADIDPCGYDFVEIIVVVNLLHIANHYHKTKIKI